MLRLVPRHPAKTTASAILEKLAEEGLEVSKRTIERDLQELSGLFPIVSDERERPFGWSWQKDSAAFDLPGLTNTEALAIKLVEEHLQGLMPETVISHLYPYFRAADKTLSAGARHGYAKWPGKIRVLPSAQPLLPPKIRSDVQHTVYESVLRERQLDIVYKGREEQSGKRATIHPLAIVQRGAVTYLVCTFFDYSDLRLLALHRTESAEIREEAIRKPREFNLDKYLASGAMGFGDGEMIRLVAIFDKRAAEHLHETPLSKNQKIESQSVDQVKVTATVPNTMQLAWWLLGFGEYVEVVAPKKLRALMMEHAKGLFDRYCG